MTYNYFTYLSYAEKENASKMQEEGRDERNVSKEN